MQLMMSGLGALIMTAIVGLSVFFVVADELRGYNGTSEPPAAAAPPAPALGLDDVFPGTQLQAGTGQPYLIGLTHSDTDCATAATGGVGVTLRDHGCAQVIRASMTAPYDGYQVTAGVFTMPDADSAGPVSTQLGPLVEAGDGNFPPLGAARQGLSQMNWHSQGRYLLYCAISRPDGTLVRDNDPAATRIATDLLTDYLPRTVQPRPQSR